MFCKFVESWWGAGRNRSVILLLLGGVLAEQVLYCDRAGGKWSVNELLLGGALDENDVPTLKTKPAKLLVFPTPQM